MNEETGVMIAVLSGGEVRVELAEALIRMSHDERYSLSLMWSWARPVSANRQQIARRFLQSTADYLIMVDSDMWPYANLLDLVEEDKDVVIFPSPMWRPENKTLPPIVSVITTLDDGPVDYDEGPLVEVGAGGSVFLIARRVLETLAPPAFKFELDDWGLMTVTEDVYFCQKARENGFKVWAAYSHPCGHVKSVDLTDIHTRVKEWDCGEGKIKSG